MREKCFSVLTKMKEEHKSWMPIVTIGTLTLCVINLILLVWLSSRVADIQRAVGNSPTDYYDNSDVINAVESAEDRIIRSIEDAESDVVSSVEDAESAIKSTIMIWN